MARLKDHLNAPPEVISWVITKVVVWPIVVARVAIIGAVLLLWLFYGSRVAKRTLEGVRVAMSEPNTNRPPVRSRAMQALLDDLNDVRARLDGLRPVPEPRTFRRYQLADKSRKACSSAQQTVCE